MTFKKFFGRTWIGPSKSFEKSAVDYDESLYFSLSFNDKNILLVIELVAQNEEGDFFSIGWSTFRPFGTESNSESRKK